MFDNVMVHVSAKMPALGISSSSVPEVVGEDASSAANFTDLLQAIVSGLDKGTGNLQGGSIIRADGKTASSDNLIELMQKLSKDQGVGSDKKSASGDSMTDLLQQMMAQLQASSVQPETFRAHYQSNNNSSSDTSTIDANGMDSGTAGSGALITALESKIQKGDVKKQSAGNTSELPVAGQTTGKQLDMSYVPLTPNSVVTGQNGPVTAQGNDQTNGANLDFRAAGLKSLTDNSERPTQASATQNAANASAGNAARLDAANVSRLDTANASQGTANASTLNAARLDTANASRLDASNTSRADTANTSRFSIPNDTTQNAPNDTAQNNANDTARNAANTATPNTANASSLKSELGALNALIDGITGDSGTKDKELGLNSNNANKSVTGDADSNTTFGPASLQQTPLSHDSQAPQATVPVNKLNELSEPIIKTLGSGEKNLVIKLSPPDMGTIEIRLKMENGVLTANFKVDSSTVKDLFAIAMPEIKNSIESSGIKTGNFFANLKDDRPKDEGKQQDTNQQQQRQQKEKKPSFFDFFA